MSAHNRTELVAEDNKYHWCGEVGTTCISVEIEGGMIRWTPVFGILNLQIRKANLSDDTNIQQHKKEQSREKIN